MDILDLNYFLGGTTLTNWWYTNNSNGNMCL